MRLRFVNVSELIGRVATNPHGTEFVITSVQYDLENDLTVYGLSMPDSDGKVVPDTECGVPNLKGFTVG